MAKFQMISLVNSFLISANSRDQRMKIIVLKCYRCWPKTFLIHEEWKHTKFTLFFYKKQHQNLGGFTSAWYREILIEYSVHYAYTKTGRLKFHYCFLGPVYWLSLWCLSIGGEWGCSWQKIGGKEGHSLMFFLFINRWEKQVSLWLKLDIKCESRMFQTLSARKRRGGGRLRKW